MTYYIFVYKGQINGRGCSECVSDDWLNVEVTKEMFDALGEYGNDYYIYSDGEIALNPNYEQEQAQKEQDRINNLTMTALDFVTLIKSCGISSQQIKTYLEENLELDMQLKYCQNVYCGVVRQLLPIQIGDIVITDELVVQAFKAKNGISE